MEQSPIRRLAGALSGRSAQPEEQTPWYTPEELCAKLCPLPDDPFDAYAFAREPLAGRLSQADRAALAQQARASGRAAADRLLARYPGQSAEGLCGELGLSILRRGEAADGGRVLYAQFVPPGEITVFTHCVSAAAALAQESGPLSWLRAGPLEQVLLAHELYHALEERDPTLFSRAYRLRLWALGPLHNDSPLFVLGEIAGMAFARALTGLPFSPYALEALLCWGYDPAGACTLCDEMLSYYKE